MILGPVYLARTLARVTTFINHPQGRFIMYILSTNALGIVTYMYNIQEYLLIKNTSRANFLKFCDRQTIITYTALQWFTLFWDRLETGTCLCKKIYTHFIIEEPWFLFTQHGNEICLCFVCLFVWFFFREGLDIHGIRPIWPWSTLLWPI